MIGSLRVAAGASRSRAIRSVLIAFLFFGITAVTGSPRAAEAVHREADRRLETLTSHDGPEAR